MNRTAMLRHHLAYNHVPSFHPTLVPVAEAAIDTVAAEFDGVELTNEGVLDTILELPNGTELTVREAMDLMHLWDFVTMEEQ